MLKYLYIVYSAKPGGRLEPWGPSSLFKRSRSTRIALVSAMPIKILRSAVYGGSTGGQFVRSSGQQIVSRSWTDGQIDRRSMWSAYAGSTDKNRKQIIGLCNSNATSDHQQTISRSSGQRIIRSADHPVIRSADHPVIRSADRHAASQ